MRGFLIIVSILDFGFLWLMIFVVNVNVVVIVGLFGYCVFELIKFKKVIIKFDVYSFGIVLLEFFIGNFLFWLVVFLGILGSGLFNFIIFFFFFDLIGFILFLI